MRPDRVKALVALGVPYFPRPAGGSFLTGFRDSVGQGFYLVRFQKKGVAESLFEKVGYDRVLKGLFVGGCRFKHQDKPEEEDFTPDVPEAFPPWFTEQDLAHFVQTYKKSGFTTPRNVYRAIDRSWELKAPWTDCAIPNTPVLFIIGDNDLAFDFPGFQEYVHGEAFQTLVPKLKATIIVEGAPHFVQQEQPQLVSAEIIKFFKEQL